MFVQLAADQVRALRARAEQVVTASDVLTPPSKNAVLYLTRDRARPHRVTLARRQALSRVSGPRLHRAHARDFAIDCRVMSWA